jgi:hypothetical protein
VNVLLFRAGYGLKWENKIWIVYSNYITIH